MGTIAYETKDETSEVVDSDGHKLQWRAVKISEVGGSAFAIWWNGMKAAGVGSNCLFTENISTLPFT